MILVLLLFLAALSLEGIGTYISVIGLAATFAADPIILTMAVVLDFCKVIAVNTLAKSWALLSKSIRTYLVASTLVLSIITSAGVAGYLSNSFQKAMLPNQGNDIALVNLKSEQDRLNARKKEIDAQIAQLPPNNVRGRQRLMTSFKPETDHINTRLIEIDKELPKLQSTQATLHTEVGSIMYLAEVAGITPSAAVGIIIALIIFVFDPMAIVFLITANGLLTNLRRPKKEPEPEKVIVIDDVQEFMNRDNPIIQGDLKVDGSMEINLAPPPADPVTKDYVEQQTPLIMEEDYSFDHSKEHSALARERDGTATEEDKKYLAEVRQRMEKFFENLPKQEPIVSEPIARSYPLVVAEPARERIAEPEHWPFPMARPEDRIQPEEKIQVPNTQLKILNPPQIEWIEGDEPESDEEPGPKVEVVPQYEVIPDQFYAEKPVVIDEPLLELEPNPDFDAKLVEALEEPAPVHTPTVEEILEEPVIEKVLQEILQEEHGHLTDEERAKLDAALDQILPHRESSDEPDVEEDEEQQPEQYDSPDADPAMVARMESTLEDPKLDNIKGAKVKFVGPVWVNPKLLEIYDEKQ